MLGFKSLKNIGSSDVSRFTTASFARSSTCSLRYDQAPSRKRYQVIIISLLQGFYVLSVQSPRAQQSLKLYVLNITQIIQKSCSEE